MQNKTNTARIVEKEYSEWLKGILSAFTDRLVMHFRDQAAASLGSRKADLLYSIESIVERRPKAEATLNKELHNLFVGHHESKDPISLNELSLVDDAQVERFVSRARLVAYFMNTHGPVIKEAEARLTKLRESDKEVNPRALAPVKILQAIGAALNEFQLPEAIRVECVQLFEAEEAPTLVEGYQLVIKLLSESGIDISYEIEVKEERRPHGAAGRADHYQLGELLTSLQKLNESLDDETRTRLLDGNFQENLPEILSEVASNTDQSQRDFARELHSAHGEQLETVSKIVNAMSREENLDPRVVRLIEKLFLPVAISALKDPTKFSDSNHPGRMLIRELSLFGKNHPKVIDRRLEEVKLLVKHVRLENGHDLDIVSQAAESVWRICEQEMQSFVAESMKAGKDRVEELRLKEAKRRVALEIKEQLIDKSLPPILESGVTKLIAPWMVGRYLRHGHNSERWLESVAYMRVSIDAFQSVKDKSKLKRRIAMRDFLLNSLNERADRFTLPRVEVDSIIATIKGYFSAQNVADRLRFNMGASDNSQPQEKQKAHLAIQDSQPGSESRKPH